jgi:hypothetical protein
MPPVPNPYYLEGRHKVAEEIKPQKYIYFILFPVGT